MTTPRFLGRHFVVTGAGTGIGRAITLRLASEGAALTLLARNRERIEQTAAEAKARGATSTHAGTCDIRDPAQVEASFAKAASRIGPIHGLVANAGIGGENKAGPGDRFADIVATNIGGTYACLRAFENHLASSDTERHVVVVGSILARIGVAGYTGYCASKAGLLGLVRAAAMELAPQRVMVNAVCPGWVATEMAWQGLDGIATAMGTTRDEALKDAMKPVPLGRMSEPDDVAGLVAYLMSADARGITGQALDINNGAWMS